MTMKPGRSARSIIAVFCVFFACTAHQAPAFGGILIGRVIDKKTGESLPGANVQVLGTILGASADENGRYRIDHIPQGIYSLRASMIGYRTETLEDLFVHPERQTEIDFELEQTPIEIDPIVVLGGRTQQRLDQTAVSISVVTSKDIERRNPIDLIQALETAPGVHFVGNQINIRGSTGYTFGAGNKVLLLLDGVPVYASDTGEFNWDMIPPMDIERIEILKGAGSTLWGASALGGVVNIMTRTPAPEGKLLFSWSGGWYDAPYYEEWVWTDHRRRFYTREDVSYGKQTGPLGIQFSAGHAGSNGYTQLGDYQKFNTTGKFSVHFRNGARWTVYGAYNNIDRGFFIQWKGQNEPYEVDEANLNNRAQINQFNFYTKLTIPFSPVFAVNARASMVRTLMGTPFGTGADFNPAFGQGVEIQADWIPGPAHTVTTGMQVQQDIGSTKYFGDHRGIFIGTYVQDEWKVLPRLRLTLGFRYDRYQLIGGEKEDLFSPRFGLNWQPWSGTRIRASAGSGFRAATIVERFMEVAVMNFKIIRNEDLSAEGSWAFDVGLRQYINPNWNVDVSLFDNEYWNLIEAHLDLLRGQIQFRNIERARIRGLEWSMNWSHPSRLFGRDLVPSLQTSLTFMHHEDLKWHEPLTYRPEWLATVKAAFEFDRFRFEADFRYASQIDEVKIYPINDRVPMKFFDIRASYTVWELTLQLGINNVFQYNYAPMESNLMPMRTFTAGLKGTL